MTRAAGLILGNAMLVIAVLLSLLGGVVSALCGPSTRSGLDGRDGREGVVGPLYGGCTIARASSDKHSQNDGK